MIQPRPKTPQLYPQFSNAAWLTKATNDLEAAISTGTAFELDTNLSQIGDLVRARRELKENPFVQMAFFQQEQLVNALIACLDPTRLTIQRRVAPYGKTVLEANAQTRQAALNLLIDIDAIHDDTNFSTASVTDGLSRAIEKIIIHTHTDMNTIQAYHERLIGWPNFIAKHGDAYRTTLQSLFDVSMQRGHCDEITMLWVQGTALKELNRVQGFSGSRGTKPASPSV